MHFFPQSRGATRVEGARESEGRRSTGGARAQTPHSQAVNGARLRMWSFYCRNPLTICGSVLAAYGLGSAVVANAPNRK